MFVILTHIINIYFGTTKKNIMSLPDNIHLSRGFEITSSTEKMSSFEVGVKSGAALVLGIVPFVVSMIAMLIFKGMAYLGAHANHQSLRTVCGVVGVPSGALMVASAKVFGLTQQLVWGKYARNPTGDGINARLAWYGVSSLPGKDLCFIAKAFFSSSQLGNDEWSLKQWSQLEI